MTVAFLSASAQVGGAERVLLDLLASLRAAGPEWRLHLVSPGEGPLVREAGALGVSTHVLPFPAALASLGDAGAAGGGGRLSVLGRLIAAAPGALRWLGSLRTLLARISPGVVHTSGFKMHVLAARALPRGARLVWHVHDYVTPRPLMARLMRASASRCAAAAAVSASVADDLRAACGPSLRVHTVRNAVDLARFSSDGPRLDLAALAGMPPEPIDTVRVGLVATMGVWKGHDVFLRAVASLPSDLPLRAYVVGGGIYRTAGSEVSVDSLRRTAAELGIGDRVGFTGFVDDAAAAMRALDVVVHASTRPEPFGLVIAEAMACARPVVVSAAGGAAELASGDGAIGIPPRDSDAMAGAIRRLVEDAGFRARLGAAGRARAEREFDARRLGGEFASLYASVAGDG